LLLQQNNLRISSLNHWEKRASPPWFASWEFLTFTLQLEGEC
jgi:hypothetical protein